MFRPKLWFLWVLILFVGIFLGIGCYFIFFPYLQNVIWPSGSFQPVANDFHQKYNPNQYTPNIEGNQPLKNQTPPSTSTGDIRLKNPFILPIPYHASFRKSPSSKKRALLEYLGTIETDNGILGLVRINTGESFVVSEGEDLVISGIIIGKITPKILTYSQNGIEKVIHLGGTSN